MSRRNLHAVPPPTDKPLDLAGDIYAADRAKIAAIDWAKVHVRGDRSAPVQLSLSRLGRPLGFGVRTERRGE